MGWSVSVVEHVDGSDLPVAADRRPRSSCRRAAATSRATGRVREPVYVFVDERKKTLSKARKTGAHEAGDPEPLSVVG